MTKNVVKNLSVGILFSTVFVYALILHFSLIGIIISFVSVGAILLFSAVYQKAAVRIVEKIDIYILISFIGILALHYDELSKSFTLYVLSMNLENFTAVQIIALLAGGFLYLIINSIGNSRRSLAAKAIYKYVALLVFMTGVSIFFWQKLNIQNLKSTLIIVTLFGLIAFCRENRALGLNLMKRPMWYAFILSAVCVALSVFFPGFKLTRYNLNAFLSVNVFPWYSVLVLSLILLAVVGMGIVFEKEQMDEDSVYLTGLVGLIWVVKASVYFYFQLSWIAVCVYAIIFVNIANHFVKRNGIGKIVYFDPKALNNELYWTLIAAVGVVLSIYLIHIGYVYFWLSIIIGTVVVMFIPKILPKAARDAAHWICLLFSIAFAACTLSIQNGYSKDKIIFIVALFVFTAVIMWMINHQNNVGRNKYPILKKVMVGFFILLVAIAAFKGGSHAKLELSDEFANVGSLLLDKTMLNISTTADGKNNSVESVKYVWTDSFIYDRDDVTEMSVSELNLAVRKKHLIVWTEDSYGVVSRADYWFCDAARIDISYVGVYEIGD